MTEQQIQMTDVDVQRLTTILRSDWLDRRENVADLSRLNNELQRARVVRPSDIPRDVVTMNSRVRLRDLDSGDSVVFSLVYPPFVYPSGEVPAEMTVSVLAPIGTAVLGYRSGDEIEWDVPGGKRRLRVEEVLYQPEASGRSDL